MKPPAFEPSPIAGPQPSSTWGCGCAMHGRRLFAAALASGTLLPALAQDGLREEVGKTSRFTKLVSAEEIEEAAAQQYAQLLREAAQKRALAPASHPQVVRLRAIAQRIVPFSESWNARARQWRWEVNLFGTRELNAFCMPGGKIAF